MAFMVYGIPFLVREPLWIEAWRGITIILIVPFVALVSLVLVLTNKNKFNL